MIDLNLWFDRWIEDPTDLPFSEWMDKIATDRAEAERFAKLPPRQKEMEIQLRQHLLQMQGRTFHYP